MLAHFACHSKREGKKGAGDFLSQFLILPVSEAKPMHGQNVY